MGPLGDEPREPLPESARRGEEEIEHELEGHVSRMSAASDDALTGTATRAAPPRDGRPAARLDVPAACGPPPGAR